MRSINYIVFILYSIQILSDYCYAYQCPINNYANCMTSDITTKTNFLKASCTKYEQCINDNSASISNFVCKTLNKTYPHGTYTYDPHFCMSQQMDDFGYCKGKIAKSPCTTDYDCDVNLFCATNLTCANAATLGQSCSTSNPCISSLACDSVTFKCISPLSKNVGALATYPNECSTYYVSSGKCAVGPSLKSQRIINSAANLCLMSEGPSKNPVCGYRNDFNAMCEDGVYNYSTGLLAYLKQNPECPVSRDQTKEPFLCDKGKKTGCQNWLYAKMKGMDFSYLYPSFTYSCMQNYSWISTFVTCQGSVGLYNLTQGIENQATTTDNSTPLYHYSRSVSLSIDLVILLLLSLTFVM